MWILQSYLLKFSHNRQNPVQSLMVNSKLAEKSYLIWNYIWISNKLQRFSLKTILGREIQTLKREEQSPTQELCGWALIFYFCLWALNLLLHRVFLWAWAQQPSWNRRRNCQSSATLLPFGLTVKCSLQPKLQCKCHIDRNPGCISLLLPNTQWVRAASCFSNVSSLPWAALRQRPHSLLRLLSPVLCVQGNGTISHSLQEGKCFPALKPSLCSQPLLSPIPSFNLTCSWLQAGTVQHS